jgi:hypothetical protein
MIVESIIAGTVICYIGTLQFTKWIVEYTNPNTEKRRVLERQRKWYFEAIYDLDTECGANDSKLRTKKIHEIDDALLKLDD